MTNYSYLQQNKKIKFRKKEFEDDVKVLGKLRVGK